MTAPRTTRLRFALIAASAALWGAAARADGPVSEAQLASFLGLDPGGGFRTGDLTNLGNGPVTSGSAIAQTLTVSAGATLSFRFNFLTNAPSIWMSPLTAVDPFAFATVPTLATIADNGFNFDPPAILAPAATGYTFQTGYRTETITFASAGTYRVGFGVANVTTDDYASALLLDGVTLTSGGTTTDFFSSGSFGGFSSVGNSSLVTSSFGIAPPVGGFQVLLTTAAVPEPSSVLLMTAGLGGAAAYGLKNAGRRRGKRAA